MFFLWTESLEQNFVRSVLHSVSLIVDNQTVSHHKIVTRIILSTVSTKSREIRESISMQLHRAFSEPVQQRDDNESESMKYVFT